MSESQQPPKRAKDVPATQAMLFGVRNELKSYINSKFSEIKADIHYFGVRTEEQNAKNNVVLDYLSTLFERQERLRN